MFSVILLCVMGGGLLLWMSFCVGKLIGWYEGWEEAWDLIHNFENDRLKNRVDEIIKEHKEKYGK